jgi:hypothetical protein
MSNEQFAAKGVYTWVGGSSMARLYWEEGTTMSTNRVPTATTAGWKEGRKDGEGRRKGGSEGKKTTTGRKEGRVGRDRGKEEVKGGNSRSEGRIGGRK